jgi:hypothetical protein
MRSLSERQRVFPSSARMVADSDIIPFSSSVRLGGKNEAAGAAVAAAVAVG